MSSANSKCADHVPPAQSVTAAPLCLVPTYQMSLSFYPCSTTDTSVELTNLLLILQKAQRRIFKR